MRAIAAQWIVALVLSQIDAGDTAVNEMYSDACASLMWGGSGWWLLRNALRPMLKNWLPHWHLPLERSTVVANTGFITHRNNEFMFLMLGEVVLQIIVVTEESTSHLLGKHDDSGGGHALPPQFVETTLTASAGFVLALTLMFSFREMVFRQLKSFHSYAPRCTACPLR